MRVRVGLLGGIVVDSGDGVTHVCAVWEGFELDKCTVRLDIAGREITRQLIKVHIHTHMHTHIHIYRRPCPLFTAPLNPATSVKG